MRTTTGIALVLVAFVTCGAAGCWMSHRPHGYCDYCDGPIRSDGIDGRGGWYCSVGCRVCGDGMQSRGM